MDEKTIRSVLRILGVFTILCGLILTTVFMAPYIRAGGLRVAPEIGTRVALPGLSTAACGLVLYAVSSPLARTIHGSPPPRM